MKEAVAKKAYSKPKLAAHGSVESITKAANKGITPQDANQGPLLHDHL